MKKKSSNPIKPVLSLAVVVAFVAGIAITAKLSWERAGMSMGTPTASQAQAMVAGVRPASPSNDGASATAEPQSRQTDPVEPLPPAKLMFDALITGRTPLRKETRRFEAQKWEPDLAKALELPKGVRLERRSAIFHMQDFKYPLVRVDRVYRMDRNVVMNSGVRASSAAGASSAMSLHTAAADGTVRAIPQGEAGTTPPDARTASSNQPSVPSGVAALDAGGGEVVWDNAMVADHLMVQAQPGVARGDLQRALPTGCQVISAISAERGSYLVGVPSDGDDSLDRAMLALNHDSLRRVIQFAEPDCLISGADTTPNDTYFTTSTTDTSKQWYLPKIKAPLGWDVVKQPAAVGATIADTIANTTVVAVVDTGVDYTHPDLAANIWINPGESGGTKPTNLIDDDASGKIDDWRGWNFVDNNNNPMDDVGHGTHVAGIIGALGNNAQGTTGVCWGVKLLPLRIIKKTETGTYGTYSDAVAAMEYIRTLNSSTSRRVAVANHSWGGRGYSTLMLNAINNAQAATDPLPAGVTASYASGVNMILAQGTATDLAKIKIGMTVSGAGIPTGTLVVMVDNGCTHLSNYTTQLAANATLSFSNPVLPRSYGTLHVAAAGNSRYNNDRFPTYPASIPSGFVVSVGATDLNDEAAVWAGGAGSNYGLLTVDLFAPGSYIVSTKWKAPGDPAYDYESRNGTSMAAPQVSGTAALLRMWQPTLTELQTKMVLIDQVDRLPQLETKCLSRGRLNAAKVLDRYFQPNLQASGGSTGGNTELSGEALSIGQGLTGQAAKGTRHTLVVRSGKIHAWGDDRSYQLSGVATIYPEGAIAASATPVVVDDLDNVIMVAAGYDSSYALTSDGKVWAWGSTPMSFGEMQQVAPLWDGATPHPDATWIATSGAHALVANADGSVWAWGSNPSGELGDGTQIDRMTPVKVSGLTNVIMVEAGAFFSLALKRDGTVWQWGMRFTSSTSQNDLVPVQVGGLSNIVHISAGNGVAYAIDENGDVWWWGLLGGEGWGNYASTPEVYPGLSRMVYTSASDNGSGFLGVDADGRLWAWGDNASGQFGNSSTEPSSVPVLVNLDTTEGIAAIATSGESCMVVLGSGEVLTWGENLNGELGLGFFDAADLPVQISGLEDIERVAGGGSSFARSLAGDWFQWGQHDWRSILRPEAFQSLPTMPGNPPIEIKSVSREVHYGFPFSVGRMADGTLRAWGYPGDVDLGVQDTAIFGNPTAVAGHPGLDASQAAQVLGVTQAIDHAVSPGRFRTFDDPFELDHHLFCLAVVFSGNVQAWGDNQYGQLGDGTTIDRSTAITVSGLTGASKVAAGGSHSLALKTNGTVWAWGDNSFGQLGDGTHTQRTTPVQVTGLTGVIGIAAGYRSSIALKADGTVWVWGGADDSVLSPLGLSADRTTPIQVPGVAQITQIALALGSEPSDASFFGETDQQTALCLATSGRVWTWSWDERVVGRFDGDDPTIPAPVEGLADVSSICGGLHCAFAVKTDGSVWTWGSNNYGAMGTSSNVVTTPSHVVGFGGASQTLSTLGTGSELDSWFLDYFSASELLSANYIADESDPDGDGIPNLMEYALGLDPRRQSVSRWIQVNGVWQNESLLPTTRVDLVAPTAQSEGAYVSQLALFSLPTVDMTSGKRYLAFTVNRNGGIRQDIDYIVEVSSDLATWRSGDPHTIKVLDTAEVLEVYSATALEDAPRQFMRLRVQRREGFFCP